MLPASKSESNRALILRALAGGGTLENLSDAHDTQLMRQLLAAAPTSQELNAEDAGTVMRFLTAYLAVTGWQGRLTGTARMQERPIAVLVDALRELGARIEYDGKEGFPPLRFLGFQALDTAEMPTLAVRGDISSQYISALLMIAPVLPQGLMIHVTGSVGSWPYINLTLDLMGRFGADIMVSSSGHCAARPGGYRPASYEVEADWSAASYWYALIALGEAGSEIVLPGLRPQSRQGDHAIAAIMRDFGVETEFLPSGIRLTRQELPEATGRPYDFTHCPDLAQTVVVVAAALGRSIRLTGLQSLRIKETDRIAALQTELAKFGAGLQPELGGKSFMVVSENFQVNGQSVATYHDHRMAMAFAPLLMLGPLSIEAPEVVRKSYPRFWQELAQVGVSCQ
jgi:3-phosphoshikimate 1-carboxyvinyltransferase